MRRTPWALVIVGALATACAGPGAEPTALSAEPIAATTAPVIHTLDWQPCDPPIGETPGVPAAECAVLTVPRDHAETDGAQLQLAVARLDTAPADDQIGSLVLNPGGPGGSGIDFLVQAALTIPGEVQGRFDLVSFDPRGVGASTAVECDVPLDDEIVLLEAGDDAGWADLVAEAESRLDACTDDSRELVTWVGTSNAARDLDLLRAALGDERLSYVGYSYGTQLGTAYAELFPANVRALVLDGAVTPSTDLTAADAQQAAGFDRALERFAAACDDDEDCLLRELGPTLDVVADLRAEIAEVGSFPIDDAERKLTPGELDLGIAAALYSQDAWPFLAQGLYVADTEQDGSILHVLVDSYLGRDTDGTYSNQTDANPAIRCADDPDRPSADVERTRVEQAAAASTYFDDFLRASTGCLGFPEAIDPYVPGPAVGAPPILVIGTTGDPATPYEWAVELAGFLDSGVLYSAEGDGHTAYGSIPCVDAVVNAYLIDLEVPPDGASCADDSSSDVFLPAGDSEAEQLIALFDCLREEGVDIPEVGVADLLRDDLVDEIFALLDPSNPDFQRALLACQDLIPPG